MNNNLEIINFNINLEKLRKLGYFINSNTSKEVLFNNYSEFILMFADLPSFDNQIQNRMSPLYYQFGKKYDNNNYFSDNCLCWDLEYFDIDGKTEYIEFMQRMSIISRGELNFEKINCYKVQNELDNQVKIEFEVNGIKKEWNINFGYQDVFIQCFACICEELKTKRKYTIYDDGSQSFVLDYGNEVEIKIFNQVTGLERKFLKDTNHFRKSANLL